MTMDSNPSVHFKQKKKTSHLKEEEEKTFHDDCVSLKKNVWPPKISRSPKLSYWTITRSSVEERDSIPSRCPSHN